MKFGQILIGGFCKKDELKEYPCESSFICDKYCIGCDNFSSYKCPNTFLYTDSSGDVVKSTKCSNNISEFNFGEICKVKMNAAYQEYFEETQDIKLILIEVYCAEKKKNNSPCENTFEIGLPCMSCDRMSYTICKDELALSNADGVVEEWIGCWEGMQPADNDDIVKCLERWRNICEAKVNEVSEL